MANPLNMQVKKTGFFRPPKLDNGVLTHMGNDIVAQQKMRWSLGRNTSDAPAKPLSKPYLFRKAKIRRTNRPKRDLHLSGLLLSNFTLRKAMNGVIRAEPTSRVARTHALSANEKDQMVGFAGSDLKNVYDDAEKAFGSLAKKLWYQIG